MLKIFYISWLLSSEEDKAREERLMSSYDVYPDIKYISSMKERWTPVNA